MGIPVDVKCVYCHWEGTLGKCLGGIDGPWSCPKCGCRVEEIYPDDTENVIDEKTNKLLEAAKSVLFWWDNDDKESIRETEKRFDKLRTAVENLTK